MTINKIQRWILPPKRWESAENPKFDPIRVRPWFATLLDRKKWIPFLELAEDCYTDPAMAGRTQQQCADAFGVDVKDLREFMDFKAGVSRILNRGNQDALKKAINFAYFFYCQNAAELRFQSYLVDGAKYFGCKVREVTELWEVDPLYYPLNYDNK